ncbi:unnamed protein product [Prunus armeniaca]
MAATTVPFGVARFQETLGRAVDFSVGDSHRPFHGALFCDSRQAHLQRPRRSLTPIKIYVTERPP